MADYEKSTISAIEDLRMHVKKVEGKNKGKVRQAAEDNETEDKANGEGDGDKQNVAKDTKKKQLYQDEDNDNDIKECDAYIKETNLIPICFGVYKPE